MRLLQPRINRRLVKKIVRWLGPLCFALLYLYKIQHERTEQLHHYEDLVQKAKTGDPHSVAELAKMIAANPHLAAADYYTAEPEPPADEAPHEIVDDTPAIPYHGDYRELFSLSTGNRAFHPIPFNGGRTYNANIIPHPTMHDMWIITAQQEQSMNEMQLLTCTAGLWDDVLICISEPAVVPLEPSISGHCPGELAHVNFQIGPRNARLFHSPDVPYLIYESQSQYTCLGVWVRDSRPLIEPFRVEQVTQDLVFRGATELRRPGAYRGMETDYFMFWDSEKKMYVHHNLWPKRIFAQVDFDGSVGENLAASTEYHDQVCMAQYMPHVGPQHETIQQATNALRITLCKRSDPGCTPSDANTFIMHVFHHKSLYDGHPEYEPFVMLFQQSAPFAIYGISQRPLWIHGRKALTSETGSIQYLGREHRIPPSHTEAFYITNLSWKTHGQKYHGYMDDEIFLSFGIENTRSGTIDIRADDLLQDLAFCDMKI